MPREVPEHESEAVRNADTSFLAGLRGPEPPGGWEEVETSLGGRALVHFGVLGSGARSVVGERRRDAYLNGNFTRKELLYVLHWMDQNQVVLREEDHE